MAIYRNISMSFWTDSKVDDDFTPEDKYFYLYLLTNPHTNICGCYEVSMKQMCRDTGYNEDTVRRLLDRMERQHEVARYSTATKEVLILNWYKYNWTKSDKMLSGVAGVAQYIKNPDFKEFVFEKLRSCGADEDTLSIGYAKGMETSVSVSVSDSVSVSEEEKERGSVPARERKSGKDEQNAERKKAKRHKYGEFGWVLLTDAERDKLIADMGEAEYKRCLQCVDEAAEKTGNKNGWKNWNLVLRVCHRDKWGMRGGNGAGGAYGRADRRREEHDYDADTEDAV